MRTRGPTAIKNGVNPTAVGGAVGMPCRIPHVDIDYMERDTRIPVGFWRSVGDSYTAFVKESFLDELAHAVGRDPLTLRHTLLARDRPQQHALDAAALAIGWRRPRSPGQGLGTAVHRSFGASMAQAVSLRIGSDRLSIERAVCVCDCGFVVNPNIGRAQTEGAVAFALQATLKGPITVENGRVQQRNFDSYPRLRIEEMPAVDIHVLSDDGPPPGLGEPAVPPLGPALANAIFGASGIRYRVLPLPLALR